MMVRWIHLVRQPSAGESWLVVPMGKETIEDQNGTAQECIAGACRLVKILESRIAIIRGLPTRAPLMASSRHHLRRLILRMRMDT